MAELIESCCLGEDTLNIWKVDCSGDIGDSGRFLRFALATTGYENPYGPRQDLSYWRIYFHNAFKGANLPEIRDFFYFAEVNGTVAARLWFAYAPANDFGNFGNVFTLPEFRRRGILRKMMPHFARDFGSSSAKCLACATGSEFAARTYMDYGFQLVYGGTVGTMALVKKEYGSFNELDRKLLADVSFVRFRDALKSDQFVIDKFVRYSQAFRGVTVYSQMLDFRCCMLEYLNGNGVMRVGENSSGIAAGFAWAGTYNGINRLSFVIHPGTGAKGADLLKDLLEPWQSGPLFYFQNKDDVQGALLLEAAGFCSQSVLTDGTVVWIAG